MNEFAWALLLPVTLLLLWEVGKFVAARRSDSHRTQATASTVGALG